MKIVTYYIAEQDRIGAMTQDEFKHAGGLPLNWDDFIWQDQNDKETAIARHDDALDAYTDDANAGNPIKDTY